MNKPQLTNGEIYCPKCGEIAIADTVDNGVGEERCGPYGCEHCGWIEPKLSADDLFDYFTSEVES